MRHKFRLLRPGGMYGCEDTGTGRQQSLRTRGGTEALLSLHARNEAHAVLLANIQMARAYMMAADPETGTRPWRDGLEEFVRLKQGETRRRWLIAAKDHVLDGVRRRSAVPARSSCSGASDGSAGSLRA
ncbi:MAG: hypothetical protein ACKVYV_01455 [Limisphaerales bacterium]